MNPVFAVISEPGCEPLSPSEVADWLRVDHDRDKAQIANLIVVARQLAERIAELSLITQTRTMTIPGFPTGWSGEWFDGSAIILAHPPVQSVSVAYADADGDAQTLAAGEYQVTTAGGRALLLPLVDESWPDTYGDLDDVVITYVAGFGDTGANVPMELRQAMLSAISHLYVARGAVDDDYLDRIFRRFRWRD